MQKNSRSLISALAVVVSLSTASATVATTAASAAATTSTATSASATAARSLAAFAALSALAALAPLAALADWLVSARPVAILAVAAVVAVLSLALGRLAGVQHPLPLEAIVAVLLICEIGEERSLFFSAAIRRRKWIESILQNLNQNKFVCPQTKTTNEGNIAINSRRGLRTWRWGGPRPERPGRGKDPGSGSLLCHKCNTGAPWIKSRPS